MLFLLAGLALGAPPAHVDLDDLDHYEGLAEDFLDGPGGCWNVAGNVEWDVDLGRFGSSRGGGRYIGRIIDGVWVSYRMLDLFELVPPTDSPAWRRIPGSDHNFTPLVGHHEHLAASEQDALGVLKVIFDELGSAVDTSYLEWTGLAVELHRNVGLGKGRSGPEAEVVTVFPHGDARVSSLDVFFPEKFHTGMLRWRISNAHIRVEAAPNDQPLPALESVSAEIGVLGMGFSIAQRISYNQMTRCR